MYDVATNPIPQHGLWATPQTLADLYARIENMSSDGTERAIAWNACVLALNLAHKLVEDEILSKDIFAQ